MKGYTYLKYGLDGELEPKTIIRTEHISEYESFDETKDYDYYIFENDNMFHRCNKDGRLGAKYQDRFLNYKVLNKEFEMYCVLEEQQEHKIPEKINKIIPSQNYVISDSKNHNVDERLEIIRKRLYANELYMLDIANTLNEILDYLSKEE